MNVEHMDCILYKNDKSGFVHALHVFTYIFAHDVFAFLGVGRVVAEIGDGFTPSGTRDGDEHPDETSTIFQRLVYVVSDLTFQVNEVNHGPERSTTQSIKVV